MEIWRGWRGDPAAEGCVCACYVATRNNRCFISCVDLGGKTDKANDDLLGYNKEVHEAIHSQAEYFRMHARAFPQREMSFL